MFKFSIFRNYSYLLFSLTRKICQILLIVFTLPTQVNAFNYDKWFDVEGGWASSSGSCVWAYNQGVRLEGIDSPADCHIPIMVTVPKIGAVYWAGKITHVYLDIDSKQYLKARVKVTYTTSKSQFGCGLSLDFEFSELNDFNAKSARMLYEDSIGKSTNC